MTDDEKRVIPVASKSDLLERIKAQHVKLVVPSSDVGTYYTNAPVIAPDTAENGVSISDLEELFWTNPWANKGLLLRANRVIGEGFKLLPSDHPTVDEATAKRARDECDQFMNEINYITFFRQSILNAYIAGNEWTECLYNKLGSMVNLNHGDFKTLDFRRSLQTNKILLDLDGEPVGFWQEIPNLAELYQSLELLYGSRQTWENYQETEKRLKDSTYKEMYIDGELVAIQTRKPNYVFLEKDEIIHLAFNTINDNYFGTSMLLAAYDALQHLKQVQFATAETINEMGYPKPLVKVGDDKHSPTQVMLDDAEALIQDPVRKEGYAIPNYMELSYLTPGNSGTSISEFPEFFITAVAVGLRVPRELLTGEGDANRANAYQNSTDFGRDIESDRKILEEYIYKIFDRYLTARGFKTTGRRNPYTPKIEWPTMVAEEDKLRREMIIADWKDGLISFAEAREALGKPEIEDPSRNERYFDELDSPSTVMDGTFKRDIHPFRQGVPPSKPIRTTHALEPKSKLNPALNKENKTEGVDYKEVAQKDVGKKIKTVGKAKARKIRDIMVNGEANKRGVKAILKDVMKVGNYTEDEARRVLATEQVNLVQNAKLQEAEKSGMKFKKWVSITPRGCERCSAVCDALNGKIVPIGEDFKVTYKENGKLKRWKGKAPAAHPYCRSQLEIMEAKKS